MDGSTFWKTLSYRLGSFMLTLFIAYLLLHTFGLTSTLTIVQQVVSTVYYILFEKLWTRLMKEQPQNRIDRRILKKLLALWKHLRLR